MNPTFEIPPTAGLPPLWRDLWGKKGDFARETGELFHLPIFQLECSGTAAFIMILMTLKKQSPRQEVIIPAYTCPLVALAIAHCHLKVVLCDLVPNGFDLDKTHLASLMNQNTLAVVPTHLGGQVADVASIKLLAQKNGVFIIEDAAQALGADVGHDGEVSFFSLAVGKGLSIFEGGLLSAQDETLRRQLQITGQELSHFSLFWEFKRCVEFLGYTACYRPNLLYYVYGKPRKKALQHGDLLNAVGDWFSSKIPIHQVSRWRQSVGLAALERLPEFLSQTRLQAQRRCKQLSHIKEITIVEGLKTVQCSWPFIMILMPDKVVRDRILSKLWNSPFGVSRLFLYALPDYDYLSAFVPSGEIKNARDFADRMLTISNSLWLNDVDFAKIEDIIRTECSS